MRIELVTYRMRSDRSALIPPVAPELDLVAKIKISGYIHGDGTYPKNPESIFLTTLDNFETRGAPRLQDGILCSR